MQALVQGLFLHIAETVFEKTEFEWMGNTIQLQLLGEKLRIMI